MFNIEEEPRFTQKVTVRTPGGVMQDFRATFAAIDIDIYTSFDLGTAEGAKHFIERVLQGVEDIVGNDHKPLPDTPKLRAQLINKSWIRQGLVEAYHLGIASGEAGN